MQNPEISSTSAFISIEGVNTKTIPLVEAALMWFNFGLHVIPLHSGTTLPNVDQNAWLESLSEDTIEQHWKCHPKDDIACVVAPDMVLFGTSSKEIDRTFYIDLMKEHGGPPHLSMERNEFTQHFYILTPGTSCVPSSTTDGGVDIMGHGSVVLLAPTSGFEIINAHAGAASELFDINQDTIDCVCRHNASIASALAAPGAKPVCGSEAMPTNLSDSPADLKTPFVVEAEAAAHPLIRYSLRDDLYDLERQTQEERPLLGNIALMAQATVIYAKPNTGKTLLALHLIIEGIQAGLIEPSKLIYLNMDDHANGLLEKIQLAFAFGFHMLADGHRGFEAKAFMAAMSKMIATDTASGTVVILDTLKKFVDTMHKGQSRDFAKVIRQFVLKGGTVVALSHTNKKQGADGKPVYSGTSDIVDDFDCAFYLSEVPDGGTARTVEFTNFKRRGNVALTAAYSYSPAPDISYTDLLLSVRQVNTEQLQSLKQAAEQRSDADMIKIISGCISDGFNSKMTLIKESAERSKVSMKTAQAVIEKYSGPDLGSHLWDFDVRARGQKFFRLLKDDAPATTG